MTSRADFAARLQWWRKRRGLTQLELAGRADISQRHLSQIMNYATGVTIDVIEALARAPNTSPAALLTPRPGL